MRVTVLGCQSPYPGPGGATPGYLVETKNLSLLLDCGSGVISQLGKYRPLYQLDAVILSHYHHDHIADTGVLQYGMMVHQLFGDRPQDQPLPIYGPRDPEVSEGNMSYRQATSFHPIDENTSLRLGDAILTFLRTDHAVPCFAVKIEADGKTLVYGADSGPNTAWEDFAVRADLFICEGTYLDRNKPSQPNGHLSVRQAAEVAEKLQCRSLMVTHLYHTYRSDEVLAEAAAYTCGRCYAAEIGLQLELS
ncbi:MBL fold metallo-hydrolase [Brevibacillus sp. H7]|uniref:MBL fold metallo-hydrolase n=1 Tax=Brevibacillus sp. H7 TaxID=3349138 RepID=UPI00381A2DE8